MRRLRVLSDYSAGALSWRAGEVIEVADLVADHLLRDSPGSFAPAEAAGDGEPPRTVTRPAPAGRKRGGGA